MTKLLGCHQLVMPVAQVAGVAINIKAAQGKWHDVVDNRRDRRKSTLLAHLAQAIRSLKAPLSLALTSSTTLAFSQVAQAGGAGLTGSGNS